MKRYRITGTILLSFILDDEQQEIFLTGGPLESDGDTVWYTPEAGDRQESITRASIIDAGLEKGCLELALLE